MRVEHFLEHHARTNGAKVALIAPGRRLTYREFDRLAGQLAAALRDHGVQPGDRVLVHMDNCWEAAVSIFAVLKAGAVFSPINASTKADKLSYIAENCEARAIVTTAKLAAMAQQAAVAQGMAVIATGSSDHLPDGVFEFESSTRGREPFGGNVGTVDELAMLIYTSGSTGRPKGVMMSHRNVDAAAGSITTYLKNTPDDVILNVLPLAFDYGLYQLLMSVRLGATLVLEKSFAFPQAIFNRIREENVTGFPLVPTMAAMILQMRDLQPGFLPSLRYITNTAAALPPEHIASLQDLFPETELFSMYGLTECKRCTYLPPEELARRPDSVGIAIPGTEAYVADEDGRQVLPGETGELIVCGPHVMQGYWRNEEATARIIRPGPTPDTRMLLTGDLFMADDEGFLYFVGRKDDILKTRGEKVAPKEVEAVLHAHPGVAEAVVTGVADPVLGQAVACLIVRRNEDVSERDIIRHCAANLEDFMVPKHVVFRNELPKTDTGKVSRRLSTDTLELAL